MNVGRLNGKWRDYSTAPQSHVHKDEINLARRLERSIGEDLYGR
jgi:hypothetical protein